MLYSDNEVDGTTLMSLTETMISKILPTCRLQVKLLQVISDLKTNQHLPVPQTSAIPDSNDATVQRERYKL